VRLAAVYLRQKEERQLVQAGQVARCLWRLLLLLLAGPAAAAAADGRQRLQQQPALLLRQVERGRHRGARHVLCEAGHAVVSWWCLHVVLRSIVHTCAALARLAVVWPVCRTHACTLWHCAVHVMTPSSATSPKRCCAATTLTLAIPCGRGERCEAAVRREHASDGVELRAQHLQREQAKVQHHLPGLQVRLHG
jgi:hypothetical protein